MDYPEWRVPESYGIGWRCAWRGVKLVCTRAHYAGDAAVHPWDPGDGWDVRKAATLWAPNGPVEAGKLERIGQAETGRLCELLSEVVGWHGLS